jgi:hypothetical protein
MFAECLLESHAVRSEDQTVGSGEHKRAALGRECQGDSILDPFRGGGGGLLEHDRGGEQAAFGGEGGRAVADDREPVFGEIVARSQPAGQATSGKAQAQRYRR